MSYSLMHEKGYLAAGPSNGGLQDLENALMQKKVNPAMYPQMSNLFHAGYSTSPVRLKLECAALSRVVTQPDVKKTLIAIGKAAANAKSILILHNDLR